MHVKYTMLLCHLCLALTYLKYFYFIGFFSKYTLYSTRIYNIGTFKRSLSQLRMSSHRLCIETGRWHRPNQTPISESICYVFLEDEYYFVLECSWYLNLRNNYTIIVWEKTLFNWLTCKVLIMFVFCFIIYAF